MSQFCDIKGCPSCHWHNIQIIGIIIFIELTAYDVKKIRTYSETVGAGDPEKFTQVVTMSALNLYLDFINIFLKLLSLFGKRRN